LAQPDTLVYSAILSALAKIAAGNRCQCAHPECGHIGPCHAVIEGDRWRVRYLVAPSNGGTDSLENCELICFACHERSAAGPRAEA
jgi:5-methylcytosine-specific restriction endonuclease McrA